MGPTLRYMVERLCQEHLRGERYHRILLLILRQELDRFDITDYIDIDYAAWLILTNITLIFNEKYVLPISRYDINLHAILRKALRKY